MSSLDFKVASLDFKAGPCKVRQICTSSLDFKVGPSSLDFKVGPCKSINRFGLAAKPRFTPAGVFMRFYPVASGGHCLVLQKNETHYLAVVRRPGTSKRGGARLSTESID